METNLPKNIACGEKYQFEVQEVKGPLWLLAGGRPVAAYYWEGFDIWLHVLAPRVTHDHAKAFQGSFTPMVKIGKLVKIIIIS